MENSNRHYNTSSLSTFENINDNEIKEKHITLLNMLYSEVNNNYRNLADIRFKLLGFVPTISMIAWAELYKNILVDSISNVTSGIFISILGFSITYGIRMYDKRNDELYDDLISRGRKIEDELGISTGLFKGRIISSQKSIFNTVINHSRSLIIIYSSVFIGWIILFIWYLINFLWLLKSFS